MLWNTRSNTHSINHSIIKMQPTNRGLPIHISFFSDEMKLFLNHLLCVWCAISCMKSKLARQCSGMCGNATQFFRPTLPYCDSSRQSTLSHFNCSLISYFRKMICFFLISFLTIYMKCALFAIVFDEIFVAHRRRSCR